jgi:1,4-dihydroxy-2-naphthoate octaprenyltransferase
VGSALAFSEAGRFSFVVLFVAALCATLIQIGTNLHNDVADYERGADDPATRVGPRRATAEGWLVPSHVRFGAALVFASAFFIGLYLVYLSDWRIFVVGVVSILAGYAYSSGPRPIAYTCLGEVFVLIFFGWVAVGGTYYVHAPGPLSAAVFLGGAAIGLPAAAVLVVNNTRDLEDDRRAGRRTFPVLFGQAASRMQYALFILSSPVLALLTAIDVGAGIWSWTCLASLPAGFGLVRRFRNAEAGGEYNDLLASTARYGLLVGAILIVVLAATA